MNKNTCTTVKLAKGEMNVYDFGNVKLHAYKTKDFIDDEVFIVEKNGKAVVIESPCFFDNIKELTEYLENVKVEGMLIAYHGAGATYLPDVSKYATKNAVDFSENGGGIDFVIKQTDDAFDVEIPEINATYTHMLGHDCHSIVAGAGHADAMIAELNSYIEKGYDLILTSHYTPEDLKDAQTKIEYLENLKKIAAGVKNADEFKAEVGKQYPQYSGQNYLDMTAGFFFAK